MLGNEILLGTIHKKNFGNEFRMSTQYTFNFIIVWRLTVSWILWPYPFPSLLRTCGSFSTLNFSSEKNVIIIICKMWNSRSLFSKVINLPSCLDFNKFISGQWLVLYRHIGTIPFKVPNALFSTNWKTIGWPCGQSLMHKGVLWLMNQFLKNELRLRDTITQNFGSL